MSLTLEQIQNFKGKYPKQLWHLFMVEMWERFCFYGMRGVLTIFMVDQLMITEKQANLKYGAIQAFVYAFRFPEIVGFWRHYDDYRECFYCDRSSYAFLLGYCLYHYRYRFFQT